MLLKVQGRETTDIEGSSSHSNGYVVAKDGFIENEKKSLLLK